LNEKIGVEITVRGLVQGVGFRYFIHRRCNELGLAGFVKNQTDGSVFIYAEGSQDSINQIIELSSQGPSRSDVREQKLKKVSYSGIYTEFIISR